MRRFPKRLIGLALSTCLALVALPAAALGQQATTGTIEGIVSDSTGAVLPGATVTFLNANTGFTRDVVTDADGRYRGLALPLGTYTISVQLAGFGKAQREDVPLAVGQTHRIDFTLGVGGVAEQVEVAGGSPVVETTRSEQSSLIDERSVENLPINGRNFIDFVKLAPTVGIVQGPDGAEISINGQRGIYNNVMIDGADANNPFFGEQRGGQRPKYIISLEAVKEFQVVTDGASAEYGRSAGGFVNMVTKSGTNQAPGNRLLFRALRLAALGELRRFERRRFQPAPVRRFLRRPAQARPDLLLRVVRPERGEAAEVEGGVRGPGDQPQQRGNAAAEHPLVAVRAEQRRGRREPDAADQRRARAARQGRLEHHGASSGQRAVRVLVVSADQRHVRRADVGDQRERHRAGPQPFARGPGQQHVRDIDAERAARPVRAGAAAAAVYRTGSAGHGHRQLSRRRRSIRSASDGRSSCRSIRRPTSGSRSRTASRSSAVRTSSRSAARSTGRR